MYYYQTDLSRNSVNMCTLSSGNDSHRKPVTDGVTPDISNRASVTGLYRNVSLFSSIKTSLVPV